MGRGLSQGTGGSSVEGRGPHQHFQTPQGLLDSAPRDLKAAGPGLCM